MRVVVLALVVLVAGSAPAAEGVAHAAATDGKPHGDASMNTLCPVDGKPVDRRLQSICFRMSDPVRALWIGTCSDACWEKVSAAPAVYAPAALANEMLRERSSGPAPQSASPLPKDPSTLVGDGASEAKP